MSNPAFFDHEEMEKFLDVLQKQKDERSIESYIYIKNILNTVEFPIPFTLFEKNKRFVRTRVHKESEEFFTNVEDLSYRKDVQNIKSFGRANEPGQSFFYCSDDDSLSLIETSHIARYLEEKDFEFSTNGLWIAKENLVIVNVLTNDDIRGKHKQIDDLSVDFEKLLSDQDDEAAMAVKNFYQFISKEFSRPAENDSNHYKVTAAFTNYIFDSIDKVDGIMYPSTLLNHKGFNFVFKPETVEKKLQFLVASRRKMQFDGEKSYTETEMFDSEINLTGKGEITWKVV